MAGGKGTKCARAQTLHDGFNVLTGKTGGKTGGKAGGAEAGKSQKSHSAKAGLQVRVIGEGTTIHKAAKSLKAGASRNTFHCFVAFASREEN